MDFAEPQIGDMLASVFSCQSGADKTAAQSELLPKNMSSVLGPQHLTTATSINAHDNIFLRA